MQNSPAGNSFGTGEEADAAIRRVAWYSLAVNAALVIIKLVLSRISGSLALEADAIHSFLDVLASVALLAGIWLSSRKSKEFPYGLYKVENIVSVIIAFLVFFTAWEIVVEAFTGEGMGQPFGGWVLFAVAALVSVPYLLGTYEVRVGTTHNSPSLVADGKQHRVDVLSTSVVFVAVLAQYFGIPVDSYAAVIVAGFIAFSGWGILKDSMRTLLDASIDHTTRDAIRAAIMSDPIVTGIKGLTGRNSGRYIFVEARVVMKKTDLEEANLASERIATSVRDLVPNVERMVIHYEPEERLSLRYAVPLSDPEGTISPHFGEAAWFALLDFSVKDGALQRTELLANPASEMEKQKGLRAAELLLRHKTDVVFSRQPLTGKSPEYVFESAKVIVRRTDVATLAHLIGQIKHELQQEQADREDV
ncbi:MAG: cation diffusion facilitator family transporter [Methanomicrobiaceae archaeon]|nr:cation diffusion facilitator family transporter [Methanomicrobiaceae archaeon]